MRFFLVIQKCFTLFQSTRNVRRHRGKGKVQFGDFTVLVFRTVAVDY